MARKKVSKAFSLEQWDIKEFLAGNGKALKEILKFAVPFIISKMTIQYPGAEYAIGIVGKGVLDIVEFYIKKIEISK